MESGSLVSRVRIFGTVPQVSCSTEPTLALLGFALVPDDREDAKRGEDRGTEDGDFRLTLQRSAAE